MHNRTVITVLIILLTLYVLIETWDNIYICNLTTEGLPNGTTEPPIQITPPIITPPIDVDQPDTSTPTPVPKLPSRPWPGDTPGPGPAQTNVTFVLDPDPINVSDTTDFIIPQGSGQLITDKNISLLNDLIVTFSNKYMNRASPVIFSNPQDLIHKFNQLDPEDQLMVTIRLTNICQDRCLSFPDCKIINLVTKPAPVKPGDMSPFAEPVVVPQLGMCTLGSQKAVDAKVKETRPDVISYKITPVTPEPPKKEPTTVPSEDTKGDIFSQIWEWFVNLFK